MDSSQLNGCTSLVAVMDGWGIDGLISTAVLSGLSVLPGPRTGTFCAFSAHPHRAFNEGIYLPSHSKTTVKTKQGVWHWSRLMEPQGVMGLPHGADGKEPVCNAGDLGSIPGLGRSLGEENGNSLQYPCLENLMGRGAQSVGSQRVRHDLVTTTATTYQGVPRRRIKGFENNSKDP